MLDEKQNADTNLDLKIDTLQNKLEELNRFYNLFNDNVNTAQNDRSSFVYNSVTCLANGISVNISPVNYKKDDDTFENYRNGVYAIALSSGPVSGYLYIEPKKQHPDGDSDRVYCNPYEAGCAYELSIQEPERERTQRVSNPATGSTSSNNNILEIDLDGGENILTGKYRDFDINDYFTDEFQFKRQAYFHVKEIKSNDDYNSILISTSSGSKNLIKNEQIKYPFFVIESVEMPGYLVNVSRNTSVASGYVLNIKPANKGGTEKFSVSRNSYTNTDNCST